MLSRLGRFVKRFRITFYIWVWWGFRKVVCGWEWKKEFDMGIFLKDMFFSLKGKLKWVEGNEDVVKMKF